jgi:hypothetical protein
MSIVAVHGPNTMFTKEGGGTPVASSPAGATATKSPTNGLVYNFSFPSPGARPAADFDWTFTGPGSPAAQPDKTSGSVTFTGAGAGTIVCTVAAGAGPPAGGTYTITVAPTAGTPRSIEKGGDEPEPEASDVGAGFDPAAHTVAEVEDFVNEHPDQAEAILDLEEEGKARSTLIAFLEDRVGDE